MKWTTAIVQNNFQPPIMSLWYDIGNGWEILSDWGSQWGNAQNSIPFSTQISPPLEPSTLQWQELSYDLSSLSSNTNIRFSFGAEFGNGGWVLVDDVLLEGEIAEVPLEILNIEAANTTVCVGENINLSAETNGKNINYEWSITDEQGNVTKNTDINPQYSPVPGTYSISLTIKDDTGQSITKDAPFTITVLEQPTIIITEVFPASNETAPNGFVSFEVSGGVPPYTFSCTDNLGMTYTVNDNNQVTGLPKGNYTLMATNDINGCQASVDFEITIAVGIGDSGNKYKNILFYPNPSYQTLFFLLPEQWTNEQVVGYQVFDLQGRPVLKGELLFENQIDVSSLTEGMYQIVFKTKGNGIVFRNSFVKAK